MTNKQGNIICNMLQDTAYREVGRNKFSSASKIMLILVTEFNWQLPLLKTVKQLFDRIESGSAKRLINAIAEEANSTKELTLSERQKSSLDVFEKAFSLLAEKLADRYLLANETSVALLFYEASIRFNPDNYAAREKYYQLWENINSANIEYKKAAFLPDTSKKKNDKNT